MFADSCELPLVGLVVWFAVIIDYMGQKQRDIELKLKKE
jgi:hypothetical protein